MFDPSRLTDAERQVLDLLAHGHTAKSAAVRLGLTEGAVNERLREARRKTGASSSRELARLLGPQENRAEKIGLVPAPTHPDTVMRRKWSILLGVISMTALAAAVGAFAALAVSAPSGPPRVVSTYPTAGAKVPAGAILIKVTFDQPMRDSASFVIARDRAGFPECAPRPKQSKDGRTFTLACTLKAGKDYWIGFNNQRFQNFASTTGVPATPATLWFSAR
jgi:DNA-binding CsgD family transcriptional regulator